jgi:hypothetical protein
LHCNRGVIVLPIPKFKCDNITYIIISIRGVRVGVGRKHRSIRKGKANWSMGEESYSL